MAFLTSAVQMTEPNGLWQWFILNVFGFIGDYGWRIVLLVVFLKLILSPLDFYQRYKMRKNQSITEALKPQLEKLEKQYGEDKRTLQQKQMELNRKAGFSYMSACIPLIITLVLFITFFTGFRSVSAYMEFKQYVEMHESYVNAYNETGFDYGVRKNAKGERYKLTYDANKDYSEIDEWLSGIFLSDDPAAELKNSVDDVINDEFNNVGLADYATILMRYKEEIVDSGKTYKDFLIQYQGETDPVKEDDPQDVKEQKMALNDYLCSMSILMQAKAQDGTVEAFKENRTPFLWVKSIWVADVPWAKALPEWNTFKTTMNSYGYLADNINNNPSNVYKHDDNSEDYKYYSLIDQSTYEIVTSKVRKESDLYNTNGYLILVVLVLGLSILSQVISNMQQKKSGQAAQGDGMGMMKVMLWIMPIMLGVFALTSSSAFTLYMVVNSVMSLVINLITSLIVNAIFGKKKGDSMVVKHGRVDPNEKINKK